MHLIPWPTIIRGLTASGLTQPEIARLCHCGQSTVSDLLRGATTDPRTSTGLLLLGLARERGVHAPEWPVVEGGAVEPAAPAEPGTIPAAEPSAWPLATERRAAARDHAPRAQEAA